MGCPRRWNKSAETLVFNSSNARPGFTPCSCKRSAAQPSTYTSISSMPFKAEEWGMSESRSEMRIIMRKNERSRQPAAQSLIHWKTSMFLRAGSCRMSVSLTSLPAGFIPAAPVAYSFRPINGSTSCRRCICWNVILRLSATQPRCRDEHPLALVRRRK